MQRCCYLQKTDNKIGQAIECAANAWKQLSQVLFIVHNVLP